MHSDKDYYRILGVNRNASAEEIKSAYRRLARRYHPDANPGNNGAESRFKDVNEAYSVLADPEQRSQYDARVSGQTGRPEPRNRPGSAGSMYRRRATPGSAGARVGNAGPPRPGRGGSPGGVAADVNVRVAGLSVGLRIIGDLITQVNRTLSSADREASQRRPHPGARSQNDRDR